MDKHRVEQAVRFFWETRTQQQQAQGRTSGRRDSGNRRAVTGGRHLDGFANLLVDLLCESGLPREAIHTTATTLPGYFRPTKDWDLVVVVDGVLLASVELKAHIGPSFGNNFNNRIEETLGNAVDLLTAYREGKFSPTQKPWLGWFLLLEEEPRSSAPVRIHEPHFTAFEEFRDSSYARRYELFCERLVRERLYDRACLLLSEQESGLQGAYREPNQGFGFTAFATSLCAHTTAYITSFRK